MTPPASLHEAFSPAGRPHRGGLLARWAARRRPEPRALRLGVPLVVLVVAAVLRLYDLGDPPRIYFDETYYAQDALDIVRYGVEEGRAAHPPVGKWLIGAGIALYGSDPFGWRIAAALAGIVVVAMTYAIGLRLFRSSVAAGLAALLVAVDGLAITMSRIAMLDVFVAMFVVIGAWLALVDCQRLERGPVRVRGVRLPAARWWAGLALGLATATKWSGLLALAAALLVVGGCELLRRRRAGRRWARATAGAAGAVTLPLLLVPAVVYVASYGGWFANFEDSYAARDVCGDGPCAVSVVDRAQTWVETQVDLVSYHRNLEATHPYRSHAVTWPVLHRPVLYYLERCDPDEVSDEAECVVAPGNVAKILGLGNPALWWLTLLAMPLLGWRAIARRDWRAAVPLAFLLLQYLPWVASWRPGYLFYMTPVVPFMALALTHAAVTIAAVRQLRWVPVGTAVLALAALVWFLPLWLGLETSEATSRTLIWFSSWR